MMREIRFKAILTGNTYFSAPFDWYDLKQIPNVDVLVESTGIYDSNGVEIFEGDICVEKEGGHQSEIVFKDGAFLLAHSHTDISGNITGWYEQPLGFLTSKVIVIGNKYSYPKIK